MADTAHQDESLLADDLAHYRSNPHDPAVVTETIRAMWRLRGDRIGHAVDVPPCPFSAEELAALERDGRRVSFLPPSLATQAARPVLGAAFPEMDDFSLLPDNSVTNDVDYAGWFDYEVEVDAPRQGYDEAGLFELLAERGQVLMTLNQYIVAAQDNRLITGRYFDEAEAWSRIGSRSDGRLVAARFDGQAPIGWNTEEVHREGCLCVAYDVGPADKGSIGVRLTTGGSEVAPPGPVTYHKPVPAPPTVTDLDAEWERLVAIYLGLGFHQQLSMSEAEYRESLPRFWPQPDSYRGRFDVPLVVDTRLPWEQQAAAAGIRKSSFIHIDFEPIDDEHRTPERPYTAWFTAWGQRFPEEVSPTDAQAQLKDDERGASPHELVAMEVAYPELNASGRYWEVIGYLMPPQEIDGVGAASAFTRYVSIWRPRGVPEVACNLNPFAYTFFRPLVRGTEIRFST